MFQGIFRFAFEKRSQFSSILNFDMIVIRMNFMIYQNRVKEFFETLILRREERRVFTLF